MSVNGDGQKIVARTNINECKDTSSQLGLDPPHEVKPRLSIGVESLSPKDHLVLSQTDIQNNNTERSDHYNRVITSQWVRAYLCSEESSGKSGGNEKDTPQTK